MELNKIYNEDCLDTMKRMEDDFIDLTITSPPYDNLREYTDNIGKKWDDEKWKNIIKELYRITKKNGIVVWVVNCATINGSETGTSFKQALYAMECGFNLHDTMIYNRISPFPSNNRFHQSFEYMFIWSKGKPKTFNPLYEDKKNHNKNKKLNKYTFRAKNGNLKLINDKAKERINNSLKKDKKLMSNIWYIPAGYKVSTIDNVSFHPATFPEKLVKQHMLAWSNENEIIYDPFMGSGTVAKIAHLYKRNFIGSEISNEYYNLSLNRLEKYLSQLKLF